ncbi:MULTISPECIES: hypothetical protein [Streptomyces]|uniref:hypothetical protein n=1 Tax=Streptomyces TaxID=1883 RepID=UPI00211D9030|nr:hypothetical protein [Streptomyces sp. b84]WTE25166.1 hypothetical protein OHB50_05890 [Streptomyces anulatus]
MTISYLPAPAGPSDDVPLYEPWEGQTAALAAAGAAGRRAAAWVRSLLPPPLPVPVGGWLAGELPAAIEAAMSGLDPQECDHMAPDGRAVDGTGGVGAATVNTLAAVPVVLAEAGWLAPDQQARLLAVASAVTGAVRLIRAGPGHRDPARPAHPALRRPGPRRPSGRARVGVLCYRTLSNRNRRSGDLPPVRVAGRLGRREAAPCVRGSPARDGKPRAGR